MVFLDVKSQGAERRGGKEGIEWQPAFDLHVECDEYPGHDDKGERYRMTSDVFGSLICARESVRNLMLLTRMASQRLLTLCVREGGHKAPRNYEQQT